jgi:hypothetical protein
MSDWMSNMTRSKRADELQIKSLDETNPSTNETKSADPRVEEFLARLRTKAETIDNIQRENHVTLKEPRRRAIVEQAANPDWYQPPAPKQAAPAVSFVKRFVSSPGRKAKTG